MRAIALLLAVSIATLPAACQSAADRKDVPALIVRGNDASAAALNRAVGAALSRDRVSVAQDALTRESRLVVEAPRARDKAAAAAQGFETRPPEAFRLIKSGTACILIHERTGLRTPLPEVDCIPAP